MAFRRLLVMWVLTASSVAVAEVEPVGVSVSTNVPLRWASGNVAGTVAVGIGQEHALKLNIARFEHAPNIVGEIIAVTQGAGDEGSYRGRTIDVGASYVHYPRRLWSGASYEVGLLFRDKAHRVYDDFASPETLKTHTKTVGGRVLIGWSWLLGDHFVAQFGVGLSMGLERGTETHSYEYSSSMSKVVDVHRPSLAPEGYFRIGGAFDL